jgi:hypothetical protein
MVFAQGVSFEKGSALSDWGRFQKPLMDAAFV